MSINRTEVKHWLTMDKVLLSFVALLSLFWACIFNSLDQPMLNQPIPVVFDIERFIWRFDEFVGYFVQFFITYFCGYALYWVNHYLLVNKVMAKFGSFHYMWITALFILVATPIMGYLTLQMPINQYEFTLLPSGNQDPFDMWNFRIAFLIIAFSLPLILAFNWQRQAAELAELKQRNSQTELKWLQQQINPHFLFNTLNNLYALSLAKSDKAPESILQLSNLLRFVVYQGGEREVSMQGEIEYLNNYLALQTMRVSHRADIHFDIDSELQQNTAVTIAPLLLVTLLENAFKHGIDATDQRAWLKASLQLNEGKILFTCSNSCSPSSNTKSDENGGVGLKNLQRRLQLAYPDKHQFNIEQQEEQYTVTLAIEVNHLD